MLSLPLRQLSRRSTAFACATRAAARSGDARRRQRRAGAAERAAGRVGRRAALAGRPLPPRHLGVPARRARPRRTPTSFSYRRSTDRAYLRWTVESWTEQADGARRLALASLHKRLAVRLPAPPKLRASAATRLAYSRRLTLSLRKIYPGRVTRTFASARGATRTGTLRLWQERSAAAALLVSVHAVRRAQIAALAERRVPLYPPLRGRLDREHRKRLLRRPADGPRLHAALRLRVHRTLGHGRQLAGLGAARGGRPGARLGPRVHTVAQHRPRPAACSSRRPSQAARRSRPMYEQWFRSRLRQRPRSPAGVRRTRALGPRPSSSRTGASPRCSTR